MKRNIYLLVAGMAAMTLATSCSDSNDLTGELSKSKTISITANSPSGIDSRVAYTEATDGSKIGVAWQNTDSIKMFTDADYSALSLTSFTTMKYASSKDDHNAIFSGTFATVPAAGASLYAYVGQANAGYYKMINSGKTALSTYSLPAFISSQKGTLEDAESRNLLVANTTYQDKMICAFTYKLAILKLKLTMPSTIAANTDVEIALSAASGLKKSMTFNQTNFAVDQSTEGNIVADMTVSGGTEKDVYFCVAPSTVTDLKVEITAGNNIYTATAVSGSKTIEAGKFYTKTVNMSAVTPVTYLFVENFSKFIYGGNDADVLPGLGCSYTTDATTNKRDLTGANGMCYHSDDPTGDCFLTLSDAYRTSRGLTGWSGRKVYEHPGFLKLGTNTTGTDGKWKGMITIPCFASLTSSQNVTVSFDAMAWDQNTAETPLMIYTKQSIDAKDSVLVATINLPARTAYTAAAWQHLSVDITGATSSTYFEIVGGTEKGKNRFLLDNIRVIKKD